MTNGFHDSDGRTLCQPGRRKIENLKAVLEEHALWMKTDGEERPPAGLRDADLRNQDLSGADLRRADLQCADLTGANLSGARLDGSHLYGAILRGVDLRPASGLIQSQLAGTDLSDAKLPKEMPEFESLHQIAEISKQIQTVFLALIGSCVFSWLTITMTTDVALLVGGPAVALPVWNMKVPYVLFFWVTPVVLLCLYVYLHYFLQNLWSVIATLPAVFPDGGTLDKRAYPGLFVSVARWHVPIIREHRTPFPWIQYQVAVLSAWILVPATLFSFWLKYLRQHDWIGTMFHTVLLVLVIGFATYSRHLAVLTLEWSDESEDTTEKTEVSHEWRHLWGLVWTRLLVVAGVCICLFVFASYYSSEDRHSSDSYSGVRHSLGKWMFATLDNESISLKPDDWRGGVEATDDQLKRVRGPILRGINLRNASMQHVFLVNVDLTEAKIDGAYLLGADLRRSWLSGACLNGAILRNAKLSGAQLDNAQLDRASLKSAKLNQNTSLSGASLKGADLYGADLTAAILQKANLSRAILTFAILRSADLSVAILTEADLSSADLSDAKGLNQDQLEHASGNECTILPRA
ncbi:MAG: pentapeptide repeat-containing protein [Desulfomonilaceae bacterium]